MSRQSETFLFNKVSTLYSTVTYRGGTMISGKWVHMYKGVGGVTLLTLSSFIKYPMKMK